MNDSSSLQAGIVLACHSALNGLALDPSLCSGSGKEIHLTELTQWACSLATLGEGEGAPVPLSSVVRGGHQAFPCIKENIIPPKEIWVWLGWKMDSEQPKNDDYPPV